MNQLEALLCSPTLTPKIMEMFPLSILSIKTGGLLEGAASFSHWDNGVWVLCAGVC